MFVKKKTFFKSKVGIMIATKILAHVKNFFEFDPIHSLSSEIRGFFAQLNPLEKTNVFFFPFSFRATLNFTNMIALVVVNID